MRVLEQQAESYWTEAHARLAYREGWALSVLDRDRLVIERIDAWYGAHAWPEDAGMPDNSRSLVEAFKTDQEALEHVAAGMLAGSPLHSLAMMLDHRERHELVAIPEAMAAARCTPMDRPRTRLGIMLDGGLVTDVVSDNLPQTRHLDILVLDFDTEDAEDEDLTEVPYPGLDCVDHARVHEECIIRAAADLATMWTSLRAIPEVADE